MLIGSRTQMKQLDEKLLEKYSMIELVYKAAECLYECVKNQTSLLVFCGKGNNGADGYALTLLAHEHGIQAKAVTIQKEELSEANAYYYEQCQSQGLLLDISEAEKTISEYETVIDALFGFGINSKPLGIYHTVIDLINRSHSKVIAVDVPSGLDCDSGNPYDACVKADETITFFAMKQGFYNPASFPYLGKIQICRLDVKINEKAWLCEAVESIHIQKRRYESHKGDYGKALLICGSERYKGAALLSAKACVYGGCGLTTLCSEEKILSLMSLYCPEAVLLTKKQLKPDAPYSAALMGCGLEEHEQKLFEDIMTKTSMPLVVDATALTMLSRKLHLLDHQQRPVILTPHIKEFERLCPEYRTLADAICFARKHHVILVLKGPLTLISDGKHSYRNTTGNPAMASGGSGDVLAGMITSLLAQGYDPLESAKNGVYLHGKCADEIAKECYTALPEKLIEKLPFVMHELADIM